MAIGAAKAKEILDKDSCPSRAGLSQLTDQESASAAGDDRD